MDHYHDGLYLHKELFASTSLNDFERSICALIKYLNSPSLPEPKGRGNLNHKSTGCTSATMGFSFSCLKQNKQMLVYNKIKAALLYLHPPEFGEFTMILDLDNVFFQYEADLQKTCKNAESKRQVMPAFRVSYCT
jgi:hypothetical protein